MGDSIDWNSEDDREIETTYARMDDWESDWTSNDGQDIDLAASTVHRHHIVDCGSSSSSVTSPVSLSIDEFSMMGFPENLVEEALEACGLHDKEAVLGFLFTDHMIENSPDDDFEIDVLSKVALHRIGIRHMNVMSIEKSEVCRKIFHFWWKQSDQRGKLIQFNDVEKVSVNHLQSWISEFGGFDLIIGGVPLNNLDGKHSSLFFEYWRILSAVKTLMRC